ncbi:hypothetical protein ACWC5I_44985 [Kitasatospora sp. NPDC001574]
MTANPPTPLATRIGPELAEEVEELLDLVRLWQLRAWAEVDGLLAEVEAAVAAGDRVAVGRLLNALRTKAPEMAVQEVNDLRPISADSAERIDRILVNDTTPDNPAPPPPAA